MAAETDAEKAALGGRWVGQPIARIEDRRHLTGDANFVDDIRTAGVRHVAFARSPHGAARIEGIDTAEAERLLAEREPLEEVARAAAAEIEPGSDLHASPGLRRRLAATLVRRALEEATDGR